MAIIGIVGKPKRGKTVSACTFPKPILLIDIMDRGFESVKKARNKNGTLVVPDHDQVTIIELYHETRAKMDFRSFASTGDKVKTAGQTPDYAKGAIVLMTKYEAIMDQLFEKETVTLNSKGIFVDGTDPEALTAEGNREAGPFKTVIIDPLTGMFRLWKSAILDMNKIGELRRGDYMALEGILSNQFIPNLKSLADKIPYIILTDHEDADITETGNLLAEYPIGPSKALGKNLSEFMDNVWRMEKVGDDYVWRTKEHGFFRGAGSRWDLPDPVKPATYARLVEIMSARGDKIE